MGRLEDELSRVAFHKMGKGFSFRGHGSTVIQEARSLTKLPIHLSPHTRQFAYDLYQHLDSQDVELIAKAAETTIRGQLPETG